MKVFGRYPVVLSHGDGPYVYDVEGKKYIDFLAGIAVNVLGHAHPQLVAAISEQAAKLIHCSNLYYTAPQANLANKLSEVSGLERIFLANSGAEANEGAMKLARKYAKTISQDKVNIITAENSFHGRTLATLTATAQPKYQKGYEPLPQGFSYVPYNDIAALAAAMNEQTAAVMLEPIQGEGGIQVPDATYLEQVRALCDQHGALLIFDEIQTGMGRTGKMFAFQHSTIKPDIVTLAKGLGGGVPIGAVLASEKVAGAFGPGDHGSTFGGNPLAAAAGNAVLAVIEQEKLLANAEAIGQYMIGELNKLKAKYPALVKDVRGKGLMIGMQLYVPGGNFVTAAMQQGALINCTAGDVLRFVPPLIITRTHVDELIAILDKVLAA
ncbi:acetylornithine aminotransferase [Anaerosporomusa subterranea]|uniref:Acetylornithine aminotransferase n=2 Tax=Anaerosporomusa subterranea TaxID=1794912 RepID=A0A154BUW3_ANASB|nr:acetylornithine aminotransferase [Anaerosporomusa subterranea]